MLIIVIIIACTYLFFVAGYMYTEYTICMRLTHWVICYNLIIQYSAPTQKCQCGVYCIINGKQLIWTENVLCTVVVWNL